MQNYSSTYSFCAFFCLFIVNALFAQTTTKLKINLTIPEGIDPGQIDVRMPPLKFDKQFIYSYTFDDVPLSAYNRGFCYVNRKWIDNNTRYHYTDKRGTGFFPEKTLGYTDGCGIERRFGLGFALWPNAGKANRTPMDDISTVTDYFRWSDLLPMMDFGSSIYFHDVDDRVWNAADPESILLGFMADQEKTILKTGRGMKVLMRPNGNNNYLEAAQKYDDIVMFGHEMWGPQYVYYPKDNSLNLYKASQVRDSYSRTNADNLYLKRVMASHDQDNGPWVHFFSHGTGSDNFVIDHFVKLNDDYGKDGDDSMWFATLDEVYEYWYMKKNSKITKRVSGQSLTIEIDVPTGKYFYFTDFSLLLYGLTTTDNLTVSSSDNIYGLSYAAHDNSILMNVDFNKALLERSEKYTSLYEQKDEFQEEYKEDAIYFVNQLKKELRDPYLERLGLIDDYPKQTANDRVTRHNDYFLYGSNTDVSSKNWKDTDVADLLVGSKQRNWEGVGVNSLRTALHENYIHENGYDARLNTLKYYTEIGAKGNVVYIGDYPCDMHREKKQYVDGTPSKSYETLYEPIWDAGENGTPVNDQNDYAVYVYNLVKTYGPYVKFWEVKNEPDYTVSSSCANAQPGVDCNWWDNNPSPEGLGNLSAPIQSYIRMLRISYEVIKRMDPQAIVCTGGINHVSFLDAILRNTDNPDGGRVTAQYPFKGGAWFDCLSYHVYPAYSLQTRNSDAAVDVVIDYKKKFADVLEHHGYNGNKFPSKEVIISKVNIPNKQVGAFIGSEQAQRNFLMKAAVSGQKSDIKAIYPHDPWDLKERSETGKESEYNGFYRPVPNSPSGLIRLNESGIGWRTVSQLLANRKYSKEETDRMKLPAGIEGGAFGPSSTEDDYIYVLWAKTSKDMDETASATYTFTSDKVVGSLIVTTWNNEQYTVEGGTVNLTGSPVFIRKVENSVRVQDVLLSHTSTSIGLRKTLQITATVVPANADNKNVSWSSSNTSVATVDNAGKVSSLSPGTTTIQVLTEDGNKTATCKLTVRPDSVALSYILLSPSTKNMVVGDIFQPAVTFNPVNTSNQTITWTSSDESIARVNADGVITAYGEGKVFVTANPTEGDGKKSKYCTVVVKNGTKVSNITLNHSSKELTLGETFQLIASISPSNASNKSVVWSSSDTSIASVDATGKVLTHSTGVVTITATTVNGGLTAVCNILVKNTTVMDIPIITSISMVFP